MRNPEALGYIVTNVVVNMFGLGSAATPAGLKAMQLLQEENPKKDTASRPMVTFLVLFTSGVTMLSSSIIAIRAAFRAQDVMGFLPYAVLATACASIVGLLVDRWWNYRDMDTPPSCSRAVSARASRQRVPELRNGGRKARSVRQRLSGHARDAADGERWT
ncbi:MAG: hypothetical protein ACLTCB_04305 [Merdibacter sp.]